MILEDTLFLALGVLALRFLKLQGPARKRWVALLVLLPLLVAAPWIGSRLPVDAWVTPIAPGADLSNIAIDGLKKPVQDGQVLLAMYGPDCLVCVESVRVLDEIAREERGKVQVVAVLAGDQRAARDFRMEHVPSFPIGYSPEAILRQYYRQLPVFVLLEDGVVKKAWWREPPERSAVSASL